jgi:glyoxylase-like metal-dependent hydrolase (beta-lactamase superfamily II)
MTTDSFVILSQAKSMSEPPAYKVFALRYATMANRRQRENFIFTDAHDAIMPIDYFVWAIVGEDRAIVVDTGFDRAEGERRGRTFLRSPADLLGRIGIDAGAVRDVVLTHLHYDHAGNLDQFPGATFHIQDDEVRFATGRYMTHHVLSHSFYIEDIVGMIRRVYAGRVRFHDGTGQILPGVTLHRVGGHSGGLQIVRVHTARGWLVLASDAAHFIENRVKRSPFPIVLHVGEMMEGFRTCEELADGEDMIVPGHDPQVLKLWPRWSEAEPDIVRVDLAPRR